MSEHYFGGPPRNGKQVKVTPGHTLPTPYHVEVWVAKILIKTFKFSRQVEAEEFQRKETLR